MKPWLRWLLFVAVCITAMALFRNFFGAHYPDALPTCGCGRGP